MSSGDFPDLRAAARESLLGGTVLSTLAAVRHAWSDSMIARIGSAKVDAARELSPAGFTRALSVALASAAIAAWALTKVIPVYLGTSIPEWAWIFAATGFALSAVWPETIAREWSRSGLRRFSLWLRES